MAFDAAAFDAAHHASPDHAPEHDPAYDPIVEEVRAARQALFAAAGYDLDELYRQVTARRDARRRTSAGEGAITADDPAPTRAPEAA